MIEFAHSDLRNISNICWSSSGCGS